jgi:hypothetical protein
MSSELELNALYLSWFRIHELEADMISSTSYENESLRRKDEEGLAMSVNAMEVFESDAEKSLDLIKRMPIHWKRIVPQEVLLNIFNRVLAGLSSSEDRKPPFGEEINLLKSRQAKAEMWLDGLVNYFGIEATDLDAHPDYIPEEEEDEYPYEHLDNYRAVWNHNEAAKAYIDSPLNALNVVVNFLSDVEQDAIPLAVKLDIDLH